MKYTPAATGFPSGIHTWKRRYSSTAVEFPIRNDQKPHSHGLSDRFPSWERARRTPTYVHTRTKSTPSPEYQQPYCQTSTLIVLINDATSTRKYPLWRCRKTKQTLICTSLGPRQLPVCTSIVPYMLLDCTFICAQMTLEYTTIAPLQHMITTLRATHEYPTSNPRIHYEYPMSNPRIPYEQPTNTLRTTHNQPTNNPQSNGQHIQFRLGFACGSLGSHLQPFVTNP